MGRSTRATLISGACSLAVLSGFSSPDSPGRVPTAPALTVTGIDSAYALGAPIRFELRLSNPGQQVLTVLPFTEHAIRNVWEAVATITRPDGREFRCMPQVNVSAVIVVDPSKLVTLEPGAALTFPVEWVKDGILRVDGKYVRDSMWSLFTADEWAAFQREHHYTVNGNVGGDCFNQPGDYRVTFRLATATARGRYVFRTSEGRDMLWEGTVESPPVVITIGTD